MPAEDPLDASLQDFEPHPNSPSLLRHHNPHHPLSEPATTDPDSENDGSLHPLEEDSEIASAGGYSPPAWRRLGNGDRSSGFWRGPALDNAFPAHQQSPFAVLQDPMLMAGGGGGAGGRYSGGGSPEMMSSEQNDMVLEQAMRTRLPMGSQSPTKGRSVSPVGFDDDPTLRLPRGGGDMPEEATPASDNYIRFALRAEVQQSTSPFTTTILTALRSSPSAILVIGIMALIVPLLLSPAQPLPAGDLIKVAGVARSFEPLIYYSEHAVVQVHDLQATSVAVWDLAESVRSSDMEGGAGIVKDLDELSETMRTLAVEMTKFFARVDGDIDGILNVMSWAQLHLNRIHSSPPPSPLSTLYSHLNPLLPSSLLPPSTLQLHQSQLQLLFTEFLTTLESSITSELHHSLLLLTLFESIDATFLNLARAVIRETNAQENLHSDLLSNLWSRILGPHAATLKKFEQNRALLKNVREKTVINKGLLVEHNSKLLTLKASLESLRAKLVSPLVRGANATTLSLEDQMKGLSDVSEYLSDVRRRQKGKVMESLYASVPGKKYQMIDQYGEMNNS